MLVILFLELVGACSTPKKEFKANETLLEFQRYTVMDVDQIVAASEEVSKKLYSDQFNPKTDTIFYDKGFIYISNLSIVNGCGQFAGDIEIKSDSIILKLVDTLGISCTEQRCDRLIYKIKNLENKKFNIKKY